MKIEIIKNKVFFDSGSAKKEIHPFWLRERVNGEKYLDKGTQQRLFDPTFLSSDISINKVNVDEKYLEVDFNDGVNSKLEIDKITSEFSKEDIVLRSIEKTKWDSSLKSIKNFEYQDEFYESREMHDLLISFYKYGFVIVKNIPTSKNYIVEFANSIGSVRRTNFGEYFDVKSKPDPNDLAYTSLALAPHTDNPYRNPVPCIQLLHCIESKVSGGLSTLVDGYTVTEDLKREYPNWGAPKIREKIIKKYPDVRPPARSTVHAVLDRNGLVKHRQGRKRFKASGTTLTHVTLPNQLWCADYKGEFMLGNKQYCYPLTITDYATRYLLTCEALASTKEEFAFEIFERAFKEFGLPDSIRTDNGVPFASAQAFYNLSNSSIALIDTSESTTSLD